MKKFFTLIVSLGFLFISCGNAFQTKAKNGDTVDVSLNIPVEILASISNRSVTANARSASNSLEVSLFVNDEAPIKKSVTDFKKSVSISFPDIPVGSVVKAKANLNYNGKEYSGESKSTIVTATGTELALILKAKAKSEDGKTEKKKIEMYFEDICLGGYALDSDESVDSINIELAAMGLNSSEDYSIEDNKIIFTEPGLRKFINITFYDEFYGAAVSLLVYDNTMIGAVNQEQKSMLFENLPQGGYEKVADGLIIIIKNLDAMVQWSDILEQYYDTGFQNEVSGQIFNGSTLNFSKWGDGLTVDGNKRYMKTISLSEILGERHLSEGDTVAFVLTTDSPLQTDDIFVNNRSTGQFYYQLQENDWDNIPDEYLFANNKCINFTPDSTKSYTFVMPLNLINNPSSYCNLQLFFDCPENTTVESMSLECSIAYYIFPASQRTVVFGVGTNYDGESVNAGYDSRYEIDLPLVNFANVMYDLAEDQKVLVKLSGTVNYYEEYANIAEDNLYKTFYDLTGEVYDGAYYTVANSFKPANNDYYHPLSQEGVGQTSKKQSVANGIISNNGLFIFDSIQAPFYDRENSQQNPAHIYRFQCYVPCHRKNDKGDVERLESTTLLVIKDFNITTTVVSQ